MCIVPKVLKQHDNTPDCLASLPIDLGSLVANMLPKLLHWSELASSSRRSQGGRRSQDPRCAGACLAYLGNLLDLAIDDFIKAAVDAGSV